MTAAGTGARRLFIASLATETNSFSPFPTGWAAYRDHGMLREASRGGSSYASPMLGRWREQAEDNGFTVIESISAFAQPAGRTVRAVYEELRDAVLRDIVAAGDIDIVLLALHGAMMADGYDDCEGDLLGRVREVLPHAVIGAELDPHCHLTAVMVDAADVLMPFKLYPHTDVVERAGELFAVAAATARGEVAPVGALVDTRLLGLYPTDEGPMAAIIADLFAAEARPEVLTAGIAHGFPMGDTVDVGTRVLVYTDGDMTAAVTTAEAIADQLYAARHDLRQTMPGFEESLDRAPGCGGCVVLGDYADNPGGGAPGDSTFMLRAMIERSVADAVTGCFYDPAVVAVATDAGVGARLSVRLGGKAGPTSGDPLDLDVVVMGSARDHSQDVFGARETVGDTVWLRHGGIDIVVGSVRTQVYGTDLFTGLGIALAGRPLIVVKSSVHYRAAFAPIADHIWSFGSPGAVASDFAGIAYRAPTAPLYPRDPDPWATAGRPATLRFPSRRRR